MAAPREGYMPAEMVQRVLEAAPTSVVLVGGQALAYWMAYYRVQVPESDAPAVTRYVDFFTPNAANSAPLAQFAKAIRGKAHVLDPRAVTALIGSAIAAATDDTIYNVDLLHSVVGLERAHIDTQAITVDLPGGRTVRVMHPLDVLKSRSANVHELEAKRNAAGLRQLRLAIEVAREYLEDRIAALGKQELSPDTERERAALRLIDPVVKYAGESAAIRNAERYGIHLADAVPAWRISAPVFWNKQWPHLRQRMSPGYADRCELQRDR